MCVPNISEGTNLTVVEEIVDEIRKHKDVILQDYSSDLNHNRSVISYMGEPEAVLEATCHMAAKAYELIDMTKHKGSHPRVGAVDVVPFIPIRDVETFEAVEVARRFGKFVGERGIPVFYHEEAALTPERNKLAVIRKGQYEGMAEKLKDPAWKPDEGPAELNLRSGVTVAGVRGPAIAFNVNLNTTDVSVADHIAKAVRHITGGFRYVRGMGLLLEEKGMVQVSMNFDNPAKTPIPRVVETIRAEAARFGVSIAETELVGTIPLSAVEDIVKYYLQTHAFSSNQIIENALIDSL